MKSLLILLSLCLSSGPTFAKEKAQIITRLYQVGKDGKYCVSVTQDESRCVSGVDDNGEPYNYLDTIEGEFVIFENLSDAPHDMVFTGNNSERLPAQQPNADKAEKVLRVADLKGAMINCSYHGKMLSVGYKVRDGKLDDSVAVGGHKKSDTPFAGNSGKRADDAPIRPLVTTKLADVGEEVIARGDTEEVEALLKARPELLSSLIESRPLLAQELISKGIANDPLQGGTNDPNIKNFLKDEALAAALANGTLTPEQLAQVKGLRLKPEDLAASPTARVGFNESGEKQVDTINAQAVKLGNQTLRVTGLGNSGLKLGAGSTKLSRALASMSQESRTQLGAATSPLSADTAAHRTRVALASPDLSSLDARTFEHVINSNLTLLGLLGGAVLGGFLFVIFLSKRKRKQEDAFEVEEEKAA